ncbi:hypothetical protein [Pseudooceanicola sp. MF1-13]
MTRYFVLAVGVLLLCAMPIIGSLGSGSEAGDRTVRLTAPVAQPVTVRY